MIPARIGSVRLRYKNLALLNKRAVIEYAIINAIESKIFSKIFINSDSEKFKFFSNKYGINFFKRKKFLASSIINKFIDLKLASAVTSNSRQVHSNFKNKGINFKINEKFSKTQDLIPISTFNYAIMMWDIKKFKKNYIKNNYCFFIDKFLSIDIPEHNSFIIKNNYDLKLIENLMKFEQKKNFKVKYHNQIKKNYL